MIAVDFAKMLTLFGKWSADSSPSGSVAEYRSDQDDDSHGFALLNHTVEDGVIECAITLPQPNPKCGAFVVFRANSQSAYYAVGLGGWESAYTLLEGRHLSTTRLATAGNIANLVGQRAYAIRVILDGQRVQLLVDGVKVIDYDRLNSTIGGGLGLFAFKGTQQAIFGPMTIDDRRPNAFVAMQFSEPYNEVYRDALRPLIEEIGYEPVRIDEISQPGIILNDIWAHLTQASVVLAEVSEANPNVYYELGIAHALNKPTVLLAQRGTKLPFDLGPHRCIFYDNTIPGRTKLLEALRSTLTALLGLPSRTVA